METLEKSLEKFEKRTEKGRLLVTEKPLLEEKSLYRGLRKVEDKVYAGPTSIKYWM